MGMCGGGPVQGNKSRAHRLQLQNRTRKYGFSCLCVLTLDDCCVACVNAQTELVPSSVCALLLLIMTWHVTAVLKAAS